MRRLRVLIAGSVLLLATAAPAAAHHLVVDPQGGGNGPAAGQWVGGGPLPEQAQGQGLIVNFRGEILPAAHGLGLVQACEATRANGNAVVSFMPPPLIPQNVDCMHGVP